jgi:hypothetical protein
MYRASWSFLDCERPDPERAEEGRAGTREIATMLGVGTGTVQRIKAEMSPPA